MIITKEELSVVTPADWVPGPPQGSWTYDDYAALPDDGQRYEIVNGVLEYWIVKPKSRSIEVVVLEDREYRSLGVFSGQATLPTRIVVELPVHVEQFFM